jgi:hypothetical protein
MAKVCGQVDKSPERSLECTGKIFDLKGQINKKMIRLGIFMR